MKALVENMSTIDNSEQIQAIERNIKETKKIVELGAALKRLELNRDFRAVVMSGYFEQEAIRLVQLKASPDMQTVDKQTDIIKQIDSIGNLNMYFQTLRIKAGMAANGIASDEEMLIALQEESN